MVRPTADLTAGSADRRVPAATLDRRHGARRSRPLGIYGEHELVGGLGWLATTVQSYG